MSLVSLRNTIYSIPAFAFSIPTFPVMIMLPAFFVEVHGFDILTIGIFIFVSKLIDVTTDPIVGWLNDKNLFSRKIYIIFGGIFSAIGLSQLFLQENIDHEIFLLIWLSILYFGWTLLIVI